MVQSIKGVTEAQKLAVLRLLYPDHTIETSEFVPILVERMREGTMSKCGYARRRLKSLELQGVIKAVYRPMATKLYAFKLTDLGRAYVEEHTNGHEAVL